ncbi:MAG: hypothetical protein Q9191_002978 [Dirinaria sp. TL-2023a]
MATASNIALSLDVCGEFHVPGISPESAAKASEVLQENHELHHIFRNAAGFHNHLVHHILTLYALGATPEQIERHYNNNKTAQRPQQPLHNRVAEELRDSERYQEYLGKEIHYYDYLVYFQREIGRKGYQEVINEYLLQGDERADDMLGRMFSGFLHPIIHLGFGLEFQQPAIVAEALAQAAVHDNWLNPYFFRAEQAALSTGKSKSLVALLDEIKADTKLSTAAHWSDSNKIRDGILVRAPDEMIKYASQFKVGTEELVEKTAEATNAAIYYAGGAQHPPKQIKFDFYFIHCVNSSIFFTFFLHARWISAKNKVRLLEWKARIDLCMYASRRSPEPLMDEIVNYRPAKTRQSSWGQIYKRACEFSDDGHGSKLVRALSNGEIISKPFEGDPRFRIHGSRMWQQLGNMGKLDPGYADHTLNVMAAIDSVEDSGSNWVGSAGFDEAWERQVVRIVSHTSLLTGFSYSFEDRSRALYDLRDP